jgi:hypothetical protein
MVNLPQPNNLAVCDSVGYGILNTFVRKYITDKIFDNERERILYFYNTHQITYNGFTELISIIDSYEDNYNKFINNIISHRIFYEKSSYGKPPRSITTPQDWGEALIELTNLVSNYKRDLKNFIDIKKDPKTIQAECKITPLTTCQSPCAIKKPVFRKEFCDIQSK